MSLFLKLFNTTAEYNAYTADTENFIKPNVSYCQDVMSVHYTPVISIANAVITCDSATYNGQTQVATNIVVALNGNTLVSGTDYTVSNNDGGINAGNYTFTVNGIGNYGGSKNGTFTINKVTPTVTTPTAKVLTYNGSAQELVNAGSTNFGTLKYSLDGTSYSTSIPTATNYGSYTVYHKVEGDSNVNDVAPATVACSINKASRTLSWVSNPSEVKAGETVTVSATPSIGSGAITYSSSNSAIASVNGSVVSGVSDGSCTITASIAEDTNYATASTSYTISILHNYALDYLTFTATESGTFKLSGKTVNYSLDNGSTWTSLASNTDSPTVSAGNKIMWKATLVPSSSYGIGAFSSTGRFTVEGNAMSLLYGDSFASNTSLTGKNYAFMNLFSGCTGITSAENLLLPATTLAVQCYTYMFEGCTALTTAPELPATTLTGQCYREMFSGCTSLTTAPELPATTLAVQCYTYMFAGCTNLTTAPELPATTLSADCYTYMFQGCTSLTTAPSSIGDSSTTMTVSACTYMFNHCSSLTTAPSLPATTLATSCYYGMFFDCKNLTTAPELPATTLSGGCYSYMFGSCTSLATVPSLPATTLVTQCYSGMFQNCTSLTTVPSNMLAATNLSGANDCYSYMFYGCTNLTTAPSLPATTLAYKCYDSMFQGCTSLAAAPELPATNLSGASACYSYMFKGCTSLTTAPVLSATTLETSACTSMFSGCTSLKTAPVLLATTLVNKCYNNMFYGCTSLNYIKAMFTTTPTSTYTSNWVSGVASSGTFVKNSAATWTGICGVSTYPCNWTVQTASS